MTLTVVTVVLLGGVNIFGGRARSRASSSPCSSSPSCRTRCGSPACRVEVQSIALGLLLILSVVIPTFAHQAKSAIDRVRAGRPPPADVDRTW